METYQAIADAIADEITRGRFRPGDRLPPQRELADQRGIAVSTASRVYAELVRRGLVIGEVGRGTYVRAAAGSLGAALAEPPSAAVDLELNFPILPDQSIDMARALAAISRPAALRKALGAIRATATPDARAIAAAFLARRGWAPDAAGLAFTGNGRQAIAAAFAAVARPADRIAVEALTYPVVKLIAARLGITLVPIALDDEGLVPDALTKAYRATRFRAVYLQPVLHNPLGIVTSARRRAALAAFIEDADLIAIEDAVFSFLADDKPLAASIPERSILIDSLSKRLAPGLTLGFVAAPPTMIDAVAAGIRAGAWAPSGLALAAALRWMTDGTANRIAEAKRADAAARQKIARRSLVGLRFRSDPRAYHLWLELPEAWRAEAYVAAAARHGIAIAPASAFTVGAGHAPNAVRLALASPPRDTLERALQTLRRLATKRPSDASFE